MANNVVGASAELTGVATKEVTKMAFRGGEHVVRELGGNVIQRMWPGVYIPPGVVRQQAVLRRFEGKLAMTGNLIDPGDGLEDEDELEARVSSTAQALVEVGVVNENTAAVELRPVLPKDSIDDPIVNDRRRKAVRLLEHTFTKDYDITSLPFPDPITPSEHKDSPIDKAATWGAISADLGDLLKQLKLKHLKDSIQRRPAMVAIMGSPYSTAILESQPGRSQVIDHHGLLVLQHVGTLPEDNMLVPAGRTRTPEDPDSPGPIWSP